MAHSEFSPSQLHRIITCPASVQLCREVPRPPSSSYAAEGTLLHEYMQQIYDGVLELYQIEDAAHRDTCARAKQYVDSVLHTAGEDYVMYNELRVELKDEPEVYGTSDVVVYNKDDNTLHIMDYKMGEHVFVSPENNPQFNAYALGAIDTLKIPTHSLKVLIHVVQPRMDNFQVIETSYSELNNWRKDKLSVAINLAKGKNPPFNATPEGCMWCAGKAICPTRYAAASEFAKDVFSAFAEVQASTLRVSEMDVLDFYNKADELTSQIKAVREYILAELLRGNKVTGLKVVSTRGRRAWANEAAVARYLSTVDGLDLEDIYDTKLKSPAQVEKVASKLKKDAEFKKLIRMSEGNPTVVSEDDPRPSIGGTDVFAGVADELQ